MAQVETCSRCGTELVPGGKFCGACGAPVAPEPEPPAAAEADDAGWVTFSGMPAVGSEPDDGAEQDPFAVEDDAAADAPSRESTPVAPTVIGMPAIRFDEPPAEESQPVQDEPELEPQREREEYEVAPTVLGMPAIVMPEEQPAEPAEAAAPADPLDAAEAPAGDPDLDAELEAEVEALRAAARAQEEEAQRQAEDAARRQAEEEEARREAADAAFREAQAVALREAEEAAEREAAEAAAREAEAAAVREAEEAAALEEPADDDAAAEAEAAEEDVTAQAEAAEDVAADTEAEVVSAPAPEPDDAALELALAPAATEPAATEQEAEPVAVGRTADDHLGEAFPPYAVFRAHVGRLDEFVHLAAFDPAGRAADTLRRSGFVLLWTAFDAFVRDTLAALVERDPTALLAAAGDAAVPYGELLELSDGLTSVDGLRSGLAARELDRLRGRTGSVRDTIGLLTETFGFQDAPLPAAYLLDEESRTLDADALQALEERRDALVHEVGESVTSEEFVDAEAALSTVAVKIAGTIAAGRYGGTSGA